MATDGGALFETLKTSSHCDEIHNFCDDEVLEIKEVDFGNVPVDTSVEKYVYIQNQSDQAVNYQVTAMYNLNTIDNVFDLFVTSNPVEPGETVELRALFKAQSPGFSYTEYFMVEDNLGYNYRLTVTAKCFGPQVKLSKKRLAFQICKNVSEPRMEVIDMINKSSVDTTYQWLIPLCGQGYFQIITGNCGVIRADESIRTTVLFTGTALGIYTAELVCLVLNQEPLFINVVGTVVLPDKPLFSVSDHVFSSSWKTKGRSLHLMENCLTRPPRVPCASVYDRFLEFGTGSVTDIALNVSLTLCVTNHADDDGFIQWISDPDEIFVVDPIASIIPAKKSRLFTVRFRPKREDETYGYLICGDYQQKVPYEDPTGESVTKIKHTWFRIPCTGNTWQICYQCETDYDCPGEVVLPPTVPLKASYRNFSLSNKLDIPMHFKVEAPAKSNFVMMPMCGIVQSRGWEIITVALEPKHFGEYFETWDLVINNSVRVRIRLSGSAERSSIELMSHGYSPTAHALYEFPPTITTTTNHTTAFLHNLTRMWIQVRVISYAGEWLGADDSGNTVLAPRQIKKFTWWFYPTVPNKVYETTVMLSCVTLVDGRPIGEPSELFVHILGYSELPDLRILPKRNNLHDVTVDETSTITVKLYNNGCCHFTSRLVPSISGMDDDHSTDRAEIVNAVNSLKPSTAVELQVSVTPGGAGPRQVDVRYNVLFHNEHGEVVEIRPLDKVILIVWYDGIYPVMQVKRTISVKCPVILSNHSVWNMTNVDELNKALEECRPNKPKTVNLYAPVLCAGAVAPRVELIFVLACMFAAPVAFNLRRHKLCSCKMIESKEGISTFKMIHDCIHRALFEFDPLTGIVSPDNPVLLKLNFNYTLQGHEMLCYILTLTHNRTVWINMHVHTHPINKGILTPLRRPKVDDGEYLAVLDCGRVPINNLDPVIRLVWLYNPTDVYTTWRLLRGNAIAPDHYMRCLLYFAEVPPLGKLAIPIAFLPSEMIDYEVIFQCSFGYDTMKILVKGQGGLPNCYETRLDIPRYVPEQIRATYRTNNVYLSTESLALRALPTHSLTREILAICNDTDHLMRFIWLPERIANLVNVVMTPCWGVVQPKSCEWITMTVYTLQEPAIFTTVVACEILDLTNRRNYQRNEYLRKLKIEKAKQEFIITEKGLQYPDPNACPPFFEDLEKPTPTYLALSVSVASKGQRDGITRTSMRQIFEQIPAYDLLSSDMVDGSGSGERSVTSNNMSMPDMIRIIDNIIWEALHSKIFKYMLRYYSKEDIPTYDQLMSVIHKEMKSRLSRRVTSGICDAIVNKALFHVYNLTTKQEIAILEA